MVETKRLEDYPEHTQAFMKFVARENKCSVNEVVGWQHASNTSSARARSGQESKVGDART